MKSDDFQRSVRSHRHDRTAGDAPNLGRLARMPGTGLPKSRRRKRKVRDGERVNQNRKAPGNRLRSWTWALGGLAVVVLGLTFWLWLYPLIESGTELAEQSHETVPEPERVVSKFPSPSEKDALDLVKAAISIRDEAKVAEYFRLGTASPQEVVDFLKTLEAKDGGVDHFDWLSSVDANRLSLDGVSVSFKSGDRVRNRLALLTPDSAGKWAIDFDAFARTVKPAWKEIVEGRADVALVRVYAAADSYYNGPFQDEQQWICYGIASPDTEETLKAYCRVGSRQAAAMRMICSREVKIARATLEIRRVEGAELRQFEIVKVLAEDWVVGDTPFE